MQLDIPTLMAMGSFVAACAGVFLLVGWSQNRKMSALALWGLADIVTAAGIIFLMLGAALHQPLGSILGGCILALAHGLIWKAARTLEGRPASLVLALLGMAAVAVASWVPTMRGTAASLGIAANAIYMFAATITFWLSRKDELLARWPLILLTGAHAAVFVIGAFSTFAGSPGPYPVPSVMSLFGLIHFESNIFVLGTAVFILALVKERKAEEDRRLRECDLLAQKERAEQANEAKSEFLSNMSHELRTPMHAILSYSKMGLARVGVEDSVKLEKYFRNINIAGNRLLGLLNNLLDLAKLESGKMEFKFELDDFMDVIELTLMELDPLIKEKGIQTSREITTQFTLAVCDKQRMIQVMVNLISNAIRFSSKGSNIFIRLSDGRSPKGADALLCSVADEGGGIPEGELESVFDKFVQSSVTKTGAGGSGLGLSICREIVEAHGGKILAENGKSKGTVLSFVIARNEFKTQLAS